MSKEIGLLPLSANFEVNMASPLDSRIRVSTQADLLNSFGVYAYEGMIVTVYKDITPEKNGIYYLKALPDTDINNWEKTGAGGGATPFASDFLISDWINGGGVYYLDFNHGFDRGKVISETYKGNNKVSIDTITINNNILRIQVPSDYRFDGSIIII